jgi:hypothetical protein
LAEWHAEKDDVFNNFVHVKCAVFGKDLDVVGFVAAGDRKHAVIKRRAQLGRNLFELARRWKLIGVHNEIGSG